MGNVHGSILSLIDEHSRNFLGDHKNILKTAFLDLKEEIILRTPCLFPSPFLGDGCLCVVYIEVTSGCKDSCDIS